MSNIIEFNGITTLPIDPDDVLKEAIGKLDNVLIIGIDKDGKEYLAASDADVGHSLWLMERAKHAFMLMEDEKAK